ncbi:MAG TPA: nuclear transport factor 2 family protein [Longimicrobium sp.]|nr:nuclear transport factor 2 family protein [Longimicrobium sp.]
MGLFCRRLASLAVVFMLTVGCASTVSGGREQAGANAAVRVAADAWARAAVERDAEKMAEYFADDAFVMYPQPQPTVGRAANRAAWAAVFAQPGVRHPVTSDSVVVAASGDLAYVAGRWHLSTPAAGERPGIEVGGRYLAVWRPVGPAGAWQIVALSANTHLPAPEI